MRISIIIPTLNEAETIVENLRLLQWARKQGHEIILADGGSDDGTAPLAESFVDQCVSSLPGRALQMNEGAQAAKGDAFVFLHADTLLPEDGLTTISNELNAQKMAWGRFDVQLSGRHFLFRIIERMMNWRSRLSGIVTGDQALFISRDLFNHVQGFANIPLMEDIEISRRLNAVSKPICLFQRVVTSSRRWEKAGILKTVWLMWRLRFTYWLGADPAYLARQYRR